MQREWLISLRRTVIATLAVCGGVLAVNGAGPVQAQGTKFAQKADEPPPPVSVKTTLDVSSDTKDANLAAQIDLLTEKVAQINETALQTAVEKLVVALRKANCAGTPAVGKDCIQQHIGLAVKAIEALPEKDQKAEIEKAKEAIEKLTRIVQGREDKEPKQPTNEFINVIGAYYGDTDAITAVFRLYGKTDGLKSVIDTDPAAYKRTTFKDLDTNRVTVTPALEAAAQTADRYCSATQAVRALCHSKESCLDSTLPNPTAITGQNFCGNYEPAPYADPRWKGLIVVYQCLDKNKFEAGAVASKSAQTDDFSLARSWLPKREEDVQQRWAWLRTGEIARIACISHAGAKADSAAGKEGKSN